jgi:hypothetical protein
MASIDPTVSRDALAIRIIFPLVRVIRLLSAYRVCQLRWANTKKTAHWQLFDRKIITRKGM